MPKATKRGDSWRCMVYSHTDETGKRIFQSFTAPTKAEAEYDAAVFIKNRDKLNRHPPDLTVGKAIDNYIKHSEPVLSPTTIQAYRKVRKMAFSGLMSTPIKKLTGPVIQDAVNAELDRVSPKTVKNEYGLLSAALKSECGLSYPVKLPKVQRHIRELPPPEDVFKAIVGTDIELPCMLAIWLSFSLSEIKGLRVSDVKNGYITINRVMVQVDGLPTIKDNAKVETRLRRHRLPPYIMGLIRKTPAWKRHDPDAYLIPETRYQIYYRWCRISREHGFEMTFHDLRHMNASVMLMLGVPDKYAMERGGWSSDHVMKQVYMHTFDAARTAVDDKIDQYFTKMLPE